MTESRADFDGSQALLDADLTEVAARLFVATFQSREAQQPAGVEWRFVCVQLAGLAGLDHDFKPRLVRAEPDYVEPLRDLSRECILRWEQHLLAFRDTVGNNQAFPHLMVHALRAGWQAMAAPYPLLVVRDRLAR